VIERIERVRYPQAMVAILDKALEGGALTLEDVRGALRPFQQKSYTKNYLAFARHMLLMEGIGQYEPFYPSTRGRELYRLAQVDETQALRGLLASMPYYHLHAELRLAALLLEATALRPHQLSIILDRIHHSIPWYLEWRLPWIQQQVGWRDSANILSELAKLRRTLDDSRFHSPFIDRLSLRDWDEQLHLARVSDLTQVDNLCLLLEEQRSQHLIIDSTWLKPLELATLLLLMLGQLEDRSLDLKAVPDLIPSLETLAMLGLDLRQNQGAACLVSPVKLIFPEIQKFEYLLESLRNFPVLQSLFQSFEANPGWRYPNRDGIRQLKLNDQLHAVQSANSHSLYVYDELYEGAKGLPDSQVEVWDKYRITTDNFSSALKPDVNQFANELIQICQPGSEARPLRSVFLTDNQLESARSGNLEHTLAKIPHLYLLVLLLFDHDQSGLYPTLEAGQWQYASRPILSVLDKLLHTLDFDVWDEWYATRPERSQGLTIRLINLLLELGVALVNSNRLELTPSFQSMLLDDYAWLRNQTKFVRQRMRSIIEHYIKEEWPQQSSSPSGANIGT